MIREAMLLFTAVETGKILPHLPPFPLLPSPILSPSFLPPFAASFRLPSNEYLLNTYQLSYNWTPSANKTDNTPCAVSRRFQGKMGNADQMRFTVCYWVSALGNNKAGWGRQYEGRREPLKAGWSGEIWLRS